MIDEKRVSVVVPVYEVEQYLDRCIESIVNQTYSDLEIILVDDGSPDSCPQMCDTWAQKDPRIKVIHKANAGLGMARNTGIEHATGEYICFVDSDDYLALDTIEKTYNLAKKEQADAVHFGFSKVDGNGKIIKTAVPQVRQVVFRGPSVQEFFLPNLIAPNLKTGENFNICMSACMVLLSMKKIRETGFRFVSEREIISEDVYSLAQFYANVNTVAVVKEAFYYYCENQTSLTHVYREDRYGKIKDFYDNCMTLCDELTYSQEVKSRFSGLYMAFTIAALKMIASSNLSWKEKNNYLNDVLKDSHLYTVVSSMTVKKETRKGRKIFVMALKFKMFCLAKIMVVLQVHR